MDKSVFNYSAAIRTLGKAGLSYEVLIRSLKSQTIPPKKIIVYLAEGYPLPKRICDETIVYCKKGMAHQRALRYDEIDTEYVLLCDDDVFFPEDSVEKLFLALTEYQADCISANVFPNHNMRFSTKVLKAIFNGELPSIRRKYAFRIRLSSNYSYCNIPEHIMESQSCAGPCMLIKKAVNNSLQYEDELWLDEFQYTSGQDQIFAYKLYRYGYKLCIHYSSGIIHLDAQTGHVKDEIKADFNKRKIKYIEWYRSIYEPARGLNKMMAVLYYYSYWFWLFFFIICNYILGKHKYRMKNAIKALSDAREYVKSTEYVKIPKWRVVR